jgi:hypothetical protein
VRAIKSRPPEGKELEAQAPAKIIELVEKFERDQDIYRSSQYNETELRTEFINPFFEALGWDVYHKQECRADKREVKEEDAVNVEGKIKNPDYSFRLFDKRKFFVEVKRPSINIESGVYPAYWRRGCWSMNKEKQKEIKSFLGWLEGYMGAKVEDLTPKIKLQSYYDHDAKNAKFWMLHLRGVGSRSPESFVGQFRPIPSMPRQFARESSDEA